MILEPQTDFYIYRVLANPSDTATYYVRATIYDARTRDVLDIVDLERHTGQEYSKKWRTVADTSGLGREIVIVTKVYTDPGYTTLSDRYGQQSNTHIIKQTNVIMGGGTEVNYKKIESLIKKEVSKIKIPKPEKVDLSRIEREMFSIQKQIDEVRADVSAIYIPKPEKQKDYSNQISSIQTQVKSLKSDILNVQKSVKKIKPQIIEKKVDISGVEKSLKNKLQDIWLGIFNIKKELETKPPVVDMRMDRARKLAGAVKPTERAYKLL